MKFQGKLAAIIMILGAMVSASTALYNPTYGKMFSEYSLVTYCNDKNKINWTCGSPCKRVQKLQNVRVLKYQLMEAEGIIGYNPHENAVTAAFRGTVPWEIQNWISDIDTIKTHFPHCGNNCQVHEGFYRAFNFLRSDFIKNLQELLALYPNAQIYITGHSLGGAMATFAVIAVNIDLKRKIDKFYTIGSPRVGDQNFSTWFNESKLSIEEARITHKCDPVPHLPPEAFGFIHIGNEIFYNSFKSKKNFFFFKSDPTYVTCPVPEDKKCANSCLIPGDIFDHLTYFDLDFTLEIPICFA